MTIHWYFIVNPSAGGNKPARRLKALQKTLTKSSISYQLQQSEYAGHAQEIAHQAIQQGFKHFVVVGGDGSLNEVLQAIMRSDQPQQITLTTLPWGTGNDWARMYNIPSKPKAFLQFLANAKYKQQDVGKVAYHQHSQLQQRYFLNFIGCGFDSYLLEKMGNAGGNRWVYYRYLVKCLRAYIAKPMKVACNNAPAQEQQHSLMTMACITQFGGGGMRFAPDAKVDDGLFDVIDINDMRLWQRIMSLPYLANGRIKQHAQVNSTETACLSLDTQYASDHIAFQCDGELIGQLPFTASIQTKAITILYR